MPSLGSRASAQAGFGMSQKPMQAPGQQQQQQLQEKQREAPCRRWVQLHVWLRTLPSPRSCQPMPSPSFHHTAKYHHKSCGSVTLPALEMLSTLTAARRSRPAPVRAGSSFRAATGSSSHEPRRWEWWEGSGLGPSCSNGRGGGHAQDTVFVSVPSRSIQGL